MLSLLRIGDSRFEASAVLTLLEVPALRRRFGFDADALDTVRTWVRESGIRWGLPGAMANDVPDPGAHSWQAGLERMLLGTALSADCRFQDIAPYEAGSEQVSVLVGLLAEFIGQLKSITLALQEPRSIRQWQSAINSLIDACLDTSVTVEQELIALRRTLMSLTEESEQAGFDIDIDRDVLLRLLEQRLEDGISSHQFLNGAVTFARLTPQRSIPSKIVCVLGLNADAFPRQRDPQAWDMTARYPRRGDRSMRDDDRNLFLDTILSAREQCYLSWTGSDERTGQEREPSQLISELRVYIDHHWKALAANNNYPVSDTLLRCHPLKPFNAAYFEDGSPLFSYRHEWLPAASPGSIAKFLDVELSAPEAELIEWPDMRDFFRNPCQGFMQQRLGVRFDEAGQAPLDAEPLTLDALEQWQLKQRLVQASLNGYQDQQFPGTILIDGSLPVGRAGELLIGKAVTATTSLRAQLARFQNTPPRSVAVDLMLDGFRVRGCAGGVAWSAVDPAASR